jgi:RimJ/RimL family protein N-acetyltransferase
MEDLSMASGTLAASWIRIVGGRGKSRKKLRWPVGMLYPEGWPGIEISYVLARLFWGKGYATEGGRAAMTYAFEEFKIPRLISLIHPDNRASVRVAEKLGETFEREMDFNGRTILVYGRDNRVGAPSDRPS